MEQSFLAFDLGASSGRAVVGTLADDRLVLDEIHRLIRLFWSRTGVFSGMSMRCGKR